MKKILLLLLACISFAQVSGVFATLEKKDIWSYFQKEDGIYYCSDMHDNEYAPCSEFGYDFSNDENTNNTKGLFKLQPFGVHGKKGGWVFMKNMEPNKAFICMNEKGDVTGDCEIKYIERFDNSYGSKPVTGYVDEVVSVLLCRYLFIEHDNYI